MSNLVRPFPSTLLPIPRFSSNLINIRAPSPLYDIQKLLYGSSKSWGTYHAVNDSIRGGKSTSSFVISPPNVATFAGELDITALGGAGFASQSRTFEFPRLSLPSSTYSGLSISLLLSSDSGSDLEKQGGKVEPVQPTRFVLVLKNTKPPTRPDGRRESVISYEFEFDVEELAGRASWESASDEEKQVGTEKGKREVQVVAEWSEFKATYRGRPKEDAPPLDPSDIYELSWMCRSSFGYQAGPFSLDLVSLSGVRRESSAGGGLLGFAQRIWIGFLSLFSRLTGRGNGSIRLD